MIQLKKNELTELSNDLKLFSALCLNMDNKVSVCIKDMQPQFHNDNYGTSGHTKSAPMDRVIKELDALDTLREYSDGLIKGIEAVQKGLK